MNGHQPGCSWHGVDEAPIRPIDCYGCTLAIVKQVEIPWWKRLRHYIIR